MIGLERLPEGRFAGIPCPVCGEIYAKSGLPNHIRRHVKLAATGSNGSGMNRRSPAWWDGWKEGYKVGVKDGRMGRQKKTTSSLKKL